MLGKKIAVLGAGANGASIGADLTVAGHDVVLIDQWPEHVQAMRSRGLTIEMPERMLHTNVRAHHLCDVATFTEPFDVVLMLMKAYDSRWAAQLIEPVLKPDGLLVGVQNGMSANVIADVVGPHRTLGCVIEISSMMFDPGHVHRHSGPARSWFAVGSFDSSTRGREPEVAELLRCAGSVEIVDDILATKWMKLVSNATTLVTTAIVGLSMVDAEQLPGMREVMLRSGQEALDAGALQGYPVLPIFGLKPEDMRQSNQLVDMLLDTLMKGFVLPGTKTTVLQDWMKDRRSEVGNINGEVVAAFERHGKCAPVNAAVVELARRIERGELEPGPQNLVLLKELAGI